MPDLKLISENKGEASITGLPAIRWTEVSGGGKRSIYSEPTFNPSTNSKERLPGEPEYDNLTLRTAYSTQYALLLDQWALKVEANSEKIVVVATIEGMRYTFTNCMVESRSDFPGFNKNGSLSPKMLEIVLTVGGRSPLN